MDSQNSTEEITFILLRLSQYPRAQTIFFCLLLMSYIITLCGNSLILLLICYDPQLHTPMYFFLRNLSFLDTCYTTSSVPQMLINCLVTIPIISLGQCLAQMAAGLYLGVVECLLLAAMAYDRCVAIVDPLRYSVHMRPQCCVLLAGTSWTAAFLLTVVIVLTMPLEFCGHHVINHFSCEPLALLKLACSDLRFYESLMLGIGALTLLAPFAFILGSCGRILVAVLRMWSMEGRGKTFSTCGSHLTVVVLFYGTAISMYVMPQDRTIHDRDKIISISYGILTPMMNPLIYSLQNKEVKGAFRRLMGRKIDLKV
ncbi:PREDICTED: olfactory receptor 13H1-like [Ceratotherium simum simum]|uniref:Olfactory receptor n=1 Tax=Ceratotherium simum simum TaxID=73337 RepID=A0ABM0I335_CERSS|nr:PREDICTED: olfactory receptor 13H1-like [Ceratotherium simum simum]